MRAIGILGASAAALCIVLAAMPCRAAGEAGGTLLIHDGDDQIELGPSVGHYRDPGSTLSLSEIESLRTIGEFRPLPNPEATFGFGSGAYWLHVSVRNTNHAQEQWLLLLRYALTDRLDLYARYPDGSVRHQASGDLLPFDSRTVRYRHPNFLIELPHDETVELYLRAETKSSIQLPLSLYSPLAFAELARDSQLAMGVYNGILIALLFYNLILWLALRDIGHFWYLLHVSMTGLTMLTLYGLAFEYLWPGWPWLANMAVPVSISLSQLGLHQFARHFLDLKRTAPNLDRLALTAVAFFGAVAVSALFIDYRTSVLAATAAVFPGVLLVLLEIVTAIRRGYRPAWLFLIAWTTFLVGAMLYATLSFGLIDKMFLTEYGLLIGSALEMMLLSVALGYRYASLRNENERLVGESRQALESKVAERTDELSRALEQLSQANARLREFSRRDGLTGVFNRRHFQDALNAMLSAAQMAREPVTVLMADLDNFKNINDSYGHLAGDDCLRWVSQRMQEALSDRDALVARFGGEEFVIALPNTDSKLGLQLAERVRGDVSEAPIMVHGRPVRVTVSIGMHTFDPDRPELSETLIERADRALYRAKAAGRDQVVA